MQKILSDYISLLATYANFPAVDQSECRASGNITKIGFRNPKNVELQWFLPFQSHGIFF